MIFFFSIFKLQAIKERTTRLFDGTYFNANPFFASSFFKYDTKFILRISGYPHIGF